MLADVSDGSIATEMGRPPYVRSAADSDRRTDIAGGPKGANFGSAPDSRCRKNEDCATHPEWLYRAILSDSLIWIFRTGLRLRMFDEEEAQLCKFSAIWLFGDGA
jgi:hypothetical protein